MGSHKKSQIVSAQATQGHPTQTFQKTIASEQCATGGCLAVVQRWQEVVVRAPQKVPCSNRQSVRLLQTFGTASQHLAIIVPCIVPLSF